MTDDPHLAAVRRLAESNGYKLIKSRRRTAHLGGYMLVDKDTSMIALGGPAGAYSATLEDIEEHLRRDGRVRH